DILRTRQIPGRLPTKEEFRLSEHLVVSEMECLDICLRRPTCASFNVLTKTSHINCIAYNDIPNSLHLKPTYQNSGWLFFNVSSLELQQRTNKKCNCIILDKTPRESDKLKRTDTGWMNFNVSSQELQK
ncbi:unnamed protein product, partial [Pocillopora meandrina]